MNEKNISVRKNMVMSAILSMSSFIFPIITFPYVSRILHASGTGRINFVTSAVTYFGMFVQLGIPTYGVKQVAKVRDDRDKLSKLVHELLFINLIMAVLVYIVFVTCVFCVPKFSRNKALFFIIGLSIGLNALGIEWLYRGLEKFTYITIRSLIFKLIGIIAMFALVHNEEDYIIYGAITIFASSASNILNFINARKYINFKKYKDYNLKQHTGAVFTFFMMSVATTVYTNLDNVMLGFFKDDETVGYYGAAVKIKNILISIITSISGVLLPRASYYVEKNLRDDFARILKKTMHLVIFLAMPMTAYFMVYAAEGITFLSGTGFEGSIIPMIIIMPTLLLVGISYVTGIQMMVPLGMEKKVLISEILGAVVDLVINAILIPRFGASGAAIGTLIAEIVVLCYQLYVVRGEGIKIFEQVKLLHIFIATVISTVLGFGFKWLNVTDKVELNSFIRIALSGIVFFGFYALYMLIFKNEVALEIVGKLFKKLKKTKEED